MNSLTRSLPGLLAAGLVLTACGTSAAVSPASHPVRASARTHPVHHAHSVSVPVAALRVTVTHAAVRAIQGTDAGGSYPVTLTVRITNPTGHAITRVSGQMSTYAATFGNIDTQMPPPSPSLFPLTAAQDPLAYLDQHWGTLALTVPAHGTVSGTLTAQISHAHGPHTLVITATPYNMSTNAATGPAVVSAPFGT